MGRECMVVLSGPWQGTVYDIRDSVTVGRNPDSGICLEDPQVSRRHATISQTADGTFVRDLGSGNGTYVNERRVIECRLAAGDIVRIGTVQLRFEVVASPDEPQPGSSVRFRTDEHGRIETSAASSVYETFFRASQAATTAEQQRGAQERLAAVYKANQIISSERDLRRLFERVMDQIFALVPAHNGVILLKDERTGELVTQYVKSASGDTVISSTIVKRACDHGEAVITYDAADDARFESRASIIAQKIASAMCAPLTYQNERLGVIYVDTHGTTNAFVKSDLELLVAFSGPAAIAIKNAQYVAQLERAYHDTLIAIADLVQMRDHYTVGHTWRVTNFALEMARAIGWNEEQLRICEMGALLHDVGKIAVDDAILRKPGQLTPDEFAKMKIHPERGARMMRDVECLKPLIPYCLYHHERYDGNGYPAGLAADAIPIEGRLIAVADTFDAITSNRPYRKGLHPDVAIAEIAKGRGTQFDPAIVDALVTCYREGRITRVIQDFMRSGRSIICPFCSTSIQVPDGANEGDAFACQVCHRHVKLLQQNLAYYGDLLPETS